MLTFRLELCDLGHQRKYVTERSLFNSSFWLSDTFGVRPPVLSELLVADTGHKCVHIYVQDRMSCIWSSLLSKVEVAFTVQLEFDMTLMFNEQFLQS